MPWHATGLILPMLNGHDLVQEASALDRDEHLIRQQLQKDMEIWNGLARQKLAASKDARKKAEADVQLLANRLRLLRAEEAKALKIIEDVRQRTREVLETRMKNQQMLLDQSNFKQNSQEAVEQKRQQNNWRRVQARFARQQAQEERVDTNRRCVTEQRAEQERLQAFQATKDRERSPSLVSSTVASEDKVPRRMRTPPRLKNDAEILADEERELLARLRKSDASARLRRPALPPVALEDEGPIKAALREASFTTPRS